ncbi:MAG: single-stranded DNA-binding protein [Chloroflexi bacterium]|nr:single-stranded DNA-binding protein [Chloroflexota bacterium]
MPSGDPVTSFSVATDRAWNNRDGQKQKETTWFRVSVFGKQAENVNTYLHKGSMVLVEGRLNVDAKTGGPRTYTRQDGTVGANFDLTANTVRFLSPKGETGGDAGEGQPAAAEQGDGSADNDIPF